jgi:PhnB protein
MANDKRQALIPSLIVDGGAAAIDFYVRAFGAKELYRLAEGEKIAHAELELMGQVIMLADEYPELGLVGPKKLSGTASSLNVYVPDVDALAARAVELGAKAERPISDEFYGDRVAWLRDPFGHRWSFHTPLENVSPDEIKRRYAKMMAGA